MYESSRELIDALRATPETLAALLRPVTQAQAAAPAGEGWSILQIVCHMRDAEQFSLQRMRTMRDTENPVITGFDQAAWVDERNYTGVDLRAAFGAYTRLRADHVAELAALSTEGWQRVGWHTQHGAVTLFNHTLHVLWHDAVHMAQIARQIEG